MPLTSRWAPWLLVVAGCASRSASPPPGQPPPAPAAEAGAGSPLGTLAAAKLFDRLMDDMSRDARFIAAGDRLWKRLEGDPGLSRQGEAMIERMSESPGFQDFLARELAAGKSPAALANEVEQRMERSLDDPLVDRAMDRALEEVIDRPAVKRAAGVWSVTVYHASGGTRTLAEVFLSPAWRRKWEGILGVHPSDGALMVQIDRYLVAPEGAWAANILADALVRDPRAKNLFLRLLEAPALVPIAVDASGKILADPAFAQKSTEVLVLLLSSSAPTKMAEAVHQFLTGVPAVEQGLARFFIELSRSAPLTAQIGGDLRQLILALKKRQDVVDLLVPTRRAQTRGNMQGRAASRRPVRCCTHLTSAIRSE